MKYLTMKLWKDNRIDKEYTRTLETEGFSLALISGI